VAETGLAVARLSPESEIAEGQQAKLWFDGAKLHLFDPGDGSNLRRSRAEQEAGAEATEAAVEAEHEKDPPARAAAGPEGDAGTAPE